jgi:hypothetical protein
MARYFRRGISKVFFTLTNADYATGGDVTGAELTAGTELTNDVAEMTGFQLSNSPISTPDLQSTFTKTIIGEDTTDTPTITFYDSDASNPIRTALAKGAAGFIVLLPYGNTTTKRAEIWPIRSTGVNDEWTVGNDPARFSVQFAVTDVPVQNGSRVT